MQSLTQSFTSYLGYQDQPADQRQRQIREILPVKDIQFQSFHMMVVLTGCEVWLKSLSNLGNVPRSTNYLQKIKEKFYEQEQQKNVNIDVIEYASAHISYKKEIQEGFS